MPNSTSSEPESKQRARSSSSNRHEHPRWTLLDLDQLETAYWNHVAPALRADGRDPETEKPTHEWLSANGYRGLTYTLRKYHDLSFGEFWRDVLGLNDDSDERSWSVDDEDTVASFERYLEKRQSRLDWSEKTVDAHQYRLDRYAQAYVGTNDTEDLLAPVHPESDTARHKAADACRDTFDTLDHAVSRTTLQRIHRTVSNWYSWLVDRHVAAFNPAEGIRYNWTADDSDGPENPALDPQQVQALYENAADIREQLLVVALCAWGLRSGEVAALHQRQLILDDEDPRISFTERKNGPGSVAVIYGQAAAKCRLEELSEHNSWDGYLFPSKRSETGHRSPNTIRGWFQDLADRADVVVDGRQPVPQMGRRFWYNAYSETIEELVEEHIAEVAAEQGSASGEVVFSEYLSSERRRALRRQFMAEKLANAFE